MNNNELNEMIKKAQSMIQNNQIPDDIKNMINNFQNSNNNSSYSNINNNEKNVNATNTNNHNNVLHSNNINGSNSQNNSYSKTNSKNNINFSKTVNENSSSNTTENNSIPNIDVATLIKIQSIMSQMNSNSDDDMSRLLISLKPYLRDNKKGKLDEYLKLIKMGKITQIIDSLNGEKK